MFFLLLTIIIKHTFSNLQGFDNYLHVFPHLYMHPPPDMCKTHVDKPILILPKKKKKKKKMLATRMQITPFTNHVNDI